MIITKQAQELDAKSTEIAHKIEILCPHCGKDIDETEIANKKCNDCGQDLSEPKQNIQLHVTSIPMIATTF